MNKFIRTIAVTAALAVCAVVVPAAATDKGPFNVQGGVPAVVLSYASFDPETCTFGVLPVIALLQPPAHGTVTLGKSSHVSDKGSCAGKTFKSATVVYRANPGYHGTDTIVVDVALELYMNAAMRTSDRVTIAVVVK